jgi:hypothetical protein
VKRRNFGMKNEKEEIIYLPIFTGLGVSMGLILGEIVLHDGGLGIAFGIAIGAGIGGILDYIRNKNH